MATTIAMRPSPRTAPRQPMRPIVSAAANPTTTVPTLPPATCTAIADPMCRAGYCSARSALPTGCCGEPPNRDTTLAMANGGNEAAAAWSAVPAPMISPPEPSSVLRRKRRVRAAKPYWRSPLEMLPMVDRMTIDAGDTPNSSMTAR